jgi:hypothetical protein
LQHSPRQSQASLTTAAAFVKFSVEKYGAESLMELYRAINGMNAYLPIAKASRRLQAAAGPDRAGIPPVAAVEIQMTDGHAALRAAERHDDDRSTGACARCARCGHIAYQSGAGRRVVVVDSGRVLMVGAGSSG